MILTVPADLLDLAVGDSVPKHNLHDLIYVLQEGSPHCGGAEYRIGNTPQQGINWIGQPQNLKGVIINAARFLCPRQLD